MYSSSIFYMGVNSNSQLDISLVVHPRNRKCFYCPESLANGTDKRRLFKKTNKQTNKTLVLLPLSVLMISRGGFLFRFAQGDQRPQGHTFSGWSNTETENYLESCTRQRFLDTIINSICFFVHTKVWISVPWIILEGSHLNSSNIFRTF